jgi:hypothetical protein
MLTTMHPKSIIITLTVACGIGNITDDALPSSRSRAARNARAGNASTQTNSHRKGAFMGTMPLLEIIIAIAVVTLIYRIADIENESRLLWALVALGCCVGCYFYFSRPFVRIGIAAVIAYAAMTIYRVAREKQGRPPGAWRVKAKDKFDKPEDN